MISDEWGQNSLELVGQHARNTRQGLSNLEGALFPSVKACQICCGPIESRYNLCYQCQEHRREFRDELADVVVPLSYAVKGHVNLQQFYADLHRYKSDRPSLPACNRLVALIRLFKLYHLHCLESEQGLPICSVVAVPSGRNRSYHPLPEIAGIFASLGNERPDVPLVQARFVGQPRISRAERSNPHPDDFAINQRLAGHVVIVEDTWVTGRNAQSVAISARRQGASRVSIVVLARMLDYSYPLTKTLVDCWPKDHHFDPTVCPVPGLHH